MKNTIINNNFVFPFSESVNYFMAGFFEGEGSMNISIKVDMNQKSHVQLAPEISVSQLVRGIHILEAFKLLFGAGSIRPKEKDSLVMVYDCSSINILVKTVIPWLEFYVVPYSGKVKQFNIFKEVCTALYNKEHINNPERLKELCVLVYSLEVDKGKRKRTLEEVLELINLTFRDYTLDNSF